MTTMDPRVKQLWIEALRSGDYKKGTGSLRNENGGFCCLGVLCNLHAQEHPEIAAKQTDPQHYMGEHAELPIEVAEWAGLNDGVFGPLGEIGELPFTFRASGSNCSFGNYRETFKKEHYYSLAHMNDTGAGFRQIADVIAAAL